MGSIIFLVFLLGVMYFLMIRPQQRQAREQAARVRALEPGMMVVLNSGIHGAVAEVEDKVMWVEVAPDVELKVNRMAVAEILSDTDDDETDDHNDEGSEAASAADDD